MPVRIACGQLNQTVGDFSGNLDRIERAVRDATAAGAQVLLTPELSLSGYPPEDLLFRTAFYAKAEEALQRAATISGLYPDLHLVVGLPVRRGGRCHNGAVVLKGGRQVGEYFKRELPNYSVFDEIRYFTSGEQPLVFEVGGIRLGIAICEDFWLPDAPAKARSAGAQVLLALNASPYHLNKRATRFDVARDNVCRAGMPLIACNLVGGQDELVFDGQTFALAQDGSLAAQALEFSEDLLLVDVEQGPEGATLSGRIEPDLPFLAQVYEALKLGVRDYVEKNGFPAVLLGLSGGIDSALTLAIAVDALGAERVRAVMMPSQYTADISLADARQMAQGLGVRYDVWPIADCLQAFRGTLADEFRGLPEDTTEENIQARIRGTLLMALSNKSGAIVLTTGNKSEMAVGYCTLYGDMAGGFAVIKDIAKTLVYRLAEYRNQLSPAIPAIPARIIDRAPSAELRPDQTDQDSLPPYEILDEIVQMYMERNLSVEQMIEVGLPGDAVNQVVRLIRISEYKRRQAPVGVRVTDRAFGRDWRYPITSKFRE
ncbi:MAG: NAD+ synthase [Lautropia sp.]|nr:NAD+ synthase [Lautropia sp.]